MPSNRPSVFDNAVMRSAAFLVLCIGSRAAFAFAASRPSLITHHTTRLVLCLFAGVWALGWLNLYVHKGRMHAIEAGPGGTWWNSLRPVHAGLYIAFIAMAAGDVHRMQAWAPLALDVLLALYHWISHRLL